MSGKGDKLRPLGVNRDVWDKNWNRIFGPKKVKHAKKSVKASISGKGNKKQKG